MVIGLVPSLFGLVVSPEEFGYSWLLSFMFFLTIGIGALFLVMAHHLTDAGWSVATRRACEHLGLLLFPAGHSLPAGGAPGPVHLPLDER